MKSIDLFIYILCIIVLKCTEQLCHIYRTMKLYNFHCHNTGLRVMSLNVFKENLSEILIPVIQIKHIMPLNLF